MRGTGDAPRRCGFQPTLCHYGNNRPSLAFFVVSVAKFLIWYNFYTKSVDGNEYARLKADSEPGTGESRAGRRGGKSFRSCKLNAALG